MPFPKTRGPLAAILLLLASCAASAGGILSVDQKGWATAGTRPLYVEASSRDIRLTGQVR